jgi:nucleotide-binding universal stress UspA family protein
LITFSSSQEFAMLPIRTILHATDFSAHSRAAFEVACGLARDYGARLVVCHVVAPPVATLGGMQSVPPLPEEYGRREAEEELYRLHAPGGDVRVERRLRQGDAAAEILFLAEEIPCDVIVLGTYGRTGVGRLLLGSVAEHVLRKAPCPVLTVKHRVPAGAAPFQAREQPVTV